MDNCRIRHWRFFGGWRLGGCAIGWRTHNSNSTPPRTHRSAVVNDKTPLAVVQADQPLSLYRLRHLTRSRRLMVDGLGPFPGMLHSPSGFPFG